MDGCYEDELKMRSQGTEYLLVLNLDLEPKTLVFEGPTGWYCYFRGSLLPGDPVNQCLKARCAVARLAASLSAWVRYLTRVSQKTEPLA